MVSLNKQSTVKKLMFYSHSFFFSISFWKQKCVRVLLLKNSNIVLPLYFLETYTSPDLLHAHVLDRKRVLSQFLKKCFFLKDVDIRWIHCLFKHISYNIYYSIVYHWNFIPEHQNLYLIVHRFIFASIETVLFRLEFDYTELFLQRYYLRPSNLPSILFTR